MFKRFTQEEVSSQSQVKSSVGRGIRASILESYPQLEDEIDDILPKKESMVLAKCSNHVQLLVINKEPVFFQHRDGPWFPTLRLAHRHPDSLEPSSWRTDAGAIRFVLGGANIMCPGFTSDDGIMDHDIAVDAPVVVHAHGKQRAMCIGRVKMTKDEIAGVNKGIAVENLHFLGDGLWQLPTIE
ncbi:hypothetical protein CTAYLR_008694 [Chrysophaeum taylorii]|uniref:PUA domain-containing protein n=1 Tax=Chrysophaeum taylorii TaxID=2483200 RepID=A0AAD7UL14_9STRA|nr:hypothetical protein CTAYLR_008694 [Chrysophaeum taylorii]